MKIFKCALKGMFFTGALTAGAFLTGVTAGLFLNKEIFKKSQKLQFKENKSASSK